ncbi:MAG: EthD family reductase [Phycisphaerae bacterium]|nr:EthD family reductase [Phycisphaerae bacterium]
MVKFIALYKKPADIAAFEKHYEEVHLPLVKKWPGLRKLEVTRFTGSPAGEPRYYMMAEIYFDDKSAMVAALQSPEGKAAGKDIMSVAADIVHMMFGEVSEA